jgi:hypothetical protein
VVDPVADEQPPPSGGIFRTLHRRLGRLAGISVPVIEELYGPTRHQARVEIEVQRSVGDPAPSPGDPPTD